MMDGWKMLAGKYEHTANAVPAYFVFYNIYTGMFKLFYYCETASRNNNFFWHLKFEAKDSKAQKMLAFNGEYAEPINRMPNSSKAIIETSNITDNPSKGLFQGWNCAMFELAYDPSFENSSLVIDGYNTNTSRIELNGYLQRIINNTSIINPPFGEQLINSAFTGAINAFSTEAEKWLKDNITKSQTRMDPIIGGALIGLIAKGADLLISSINGRARRAETTNIIVRDSIKLTGTITSTDASPIRPVRFNYFDKSNIGNIGAWNLDESPTIYLSPYATYLPGNNAYESFNFYNYKINGHYRIQHNVVINPDIRSKLISYWSEAVAIDDATTERIDGFDYGDAGGGQLYGDLDEVEVLAAGENKIVYKANFKQTFERQKYYSYNSEVPKRINLINEELISWLKFATNKQVKVRVYFVVNNAQGQRDTIVSMKSFIPKITWETSTRSLED